MRARFTSHFCHHCYMYNYLQWKSKFENGRSILRLTGWPGNPSAPGSQTPLRGPELCPTRDPPVRVSGTRHWTYYVPIHTPALHIHGPRRTSGLMEVRCFQYHANRWIQLSSGIDGIFIQANLYGIDRSFANWENSGIYCLM